jgi:hypothetical protein
MARHRILSGSRDLRCVLRNIIFQKYFPVKVLKKKIQFVFLFLAFFIWERKMVRQRYFLKIIEKPKTKKTLPIFRSIFRWIHLFFCAKKNHFVGFADVRCGLCMKFNGERSAHFLHYFLLVQIYIHSTDSRWQRKTHVISNKDWKTFVKYFFHFFFFL